MWSTDLSHCMYACQNVFNNGSKSSTLILQTSDDITNCSLSAAIHQTGACFSEKIDYCCSDARKKRQKVFKYQKFTASTTGYRHPNLGKCIFKAADASCCSFALGLLGDRVWWRDQAFPCCYCCTFTIVIHHFWWWQCVHTSHLLWALMWLMIVCPHVSPAVSADVTGDSVPTGLTRCERWCDWW